MNSREVIKNRLAAQNIKLGEINEDSKLEDTRSVRESFLRNSALGIPDSMRGLIESDNNLEGHISPFNFDYKDQSHNITASKIKSIGKRKSKTFKSTLTSNLEKFITSDFVSAIESNSCSKMLKYEKQCDKRDNINFSKIQIQPGMDLRVILGLCNLSKGHQKLYPCETCGKNYLTHAALGGHIAKNHPNTSKSFKKRLQIYEQRHAERLKRKYLNDL